MGADDANEGTGPGECPQHRWRVARMVLDWRGTLFVHRCEDCDAELVEPASGDRL